MQILEYGYLQCIVGGNKTLDVACGVVGFADVTAAVAVKLGASLIPGAGWFLIGASLACAVYGLTK